MKKRVLSGIRATGRLHLGNYLGAVKGMLALQEDKEFDTLYTVVDLHTMTTPYDKNTLAKTAREVVLDYLSCGLNPEKSIIFLQSHLADLHTQLMFYFSCVVSVARMQHLPTFKEKVKQHPQNVTMALLNYPVLMAADILIYKASHVPVGIDQEPHLEVAREIARRMNQEYGTDFPEPVRFVTPGGYIPSLTGEGKMSKTVVGSYINLTDSLEAIQAKLARVPTDIGKGDKVPTEGGVAALLKFVELFQGEEKRKEYEKKYVGHGIQYAGLKEELVQAIYNELKPIQAERRQLEAEPKYVEKVIRQGAERARKIAEKTIEEIREKMGLK